MFVKLAREIAFVLTHLKSLHWKTVFGANVLKYMAKLRKNYNLIKKYYFLLLDGKTEWHLFFQMPTSCVFMLSTFGW